MSRSARKLALFLAVTMAAGLISVLSGAFAANPKLTLWSHWADEVSKKEYVQAGVDDFKKKNPNFDVEVVWYQKDALIQALNTAFAAGSGPDIFYLEPAIAGYADYASKGLMYDLTSYLDKYIDPGALRYAKTSKGMTYLLPLEAYIPMIYYNKDIFGKSGVKVPAAGRFDMDGLKDAVKKAKAAGFTPFSAGIMDRDWCANIVINSIMLRFLGREKWEALGDAKTSWKDADVVKAVDYIEELIKAGAYPDGVASMKLGESHSNFWAPRTKYAMFPMKTFFAGRAFVPVASGGMAPDFPLGIMDFPELKGGKANDLTYIQIGGSYGVYTGSKNAAKAAELLQCMAENADIWVAKVKVQTGLKVDIAKIKDAYLNAMEIGRAHV